MWPFKVRVGVTQGQSKTEIPLYIQVHVHVYMYLSVSFKRGANFLTCTFILQINGTCSGKAEVKIFKFSLIHLFAPF